MSFSSNELEKSFNNANENNNANNKITQKDDFTARIFSFIFRNIKTKSLQFKPIGVSLDEEKIPSWKVFLVLMDYIKDSSIQNRNFSDNKLLKICFPENDEKNLFAIVVNFDKSCLDYVNYANSVNLLSDEQNQQANKLRQYQNLLLNKNLLNSLSANKDSSSEAISGLGKLGSFIEKSQNIIDNPKDNFIKTEDEQYTKTESSEDTGKSIAIDSLVSKFSVEELNKIKSLIKFAKKNKVMDDIYNRKGEVNLNDLAAIKNQNSFEFSDKCNFKLKIFKLFSNYFVCLIFIIFK